MSRTSKTQGETIPSLEILELVSKLAVHFFDTEKGRNSIGFETAWRVF